MMKRFPTNILVWDTVVLLSLLQGSWMQAHPIEDRIQEFSIPADNIKVHDMFYSQALPTNDHEHSSLVSNNSNEGADLSTTTGIRCLHVHTTLIAYANATDALEYLCELHSQDVHGDVGIEYPLWNLGDDFAEKREIAKQNGMESLYIEGAVLDNGMVRIACPAHSQMTWFHDDTLGTLDTSTSSNNRRLMSSGTRTALIVRITAKGVSPGPSADQLTNAVFGSHGDPISFQEQYTRCSDGTLQFVQATGTTSKGLKISNGLVEVDVGHPSDMNAYTLSNLAKGKLGSIYAYDHTLYDFPAGTTYGDSGTDWYAFALLPGRESFFGPSGSRVEDGGETMLHKSAVVHEMGHNLGLQHSGRGGYQYGDYTCQMGISSTYYTSRCFNAAKLVQLGWYNNDRVVTVNPATSSFSGKVIGVHDVSTTSSLPAEYNLVVVIADDTTFGTPNLYLTFNVREGITGDVNVYPNEVIIVSATAGSSYWSTSNLVSHLRAGQEYTVANYKGDRDLVVQVSGMGTDNGTINYASVIVQLDVSSCSSSSDCNDLDQCTSDICLSNQCVYTQLNDCCGNGICEASAGETCTSCPDDCSSPTDCNALFASGSWRSSYGYQGFMMDMQAKGSAGIHVQSISFYSYNRSLDTGVITASVFAKTGTWVGAQNDGSKWTLVSDGLSISGQRTSVTFNYPRGVVFYYEVPLVTPVNVDSDSITAFYVSAHGNNDEIVYGASGQSYLNVDVENEDLRTYEMGISQLEFFSYTSSNTRMFKGKVLYGYGRIVDKSPTTTPSIAPTAAPVASPSAIAITPRDGPCVILSALSTSRNKWCLFPKNNYLVAGTNIALGTCQSWASYQWIIDEDGKLRNNKEQNLCIQMSGKKLSIQDCRDNFVKQRFIYSDNRRIIAVQNGRKGMAVDRGVAATGQLIKLTEYTTSGSESTPDASETWDLQMISSGINVPLKNLPNIGKFRIKSHLSTNDDEEWCINANGIGMVLTLCKTWESHKWTMDHEGKIESVKYGQCIESQGKRMFLSNCVAENLNQRWVYSVLDERLALLKKGNKQVAVNGGVAVHNAKIKVLNGESPVPSHHKWVMEKFV